MLIHHGQCTIAGPGLAHLIIIRAEEEVSLTSLCVFIISIHIVILLNFRVQCTMNSDCKDVGEEIVEIICSKQESLPCGGKDSE